MTDIHKVRKYSIFDPTTQAGNGKRGPRGPAGSNGADGTDGTDGAAILTGSGVPSNSSGNDGDFYFRTNGFVYQKDSGVWSFIDDVTGPAGAAGANGSNGSNGSNGTNGTNGTNGATWYFGSGAPSSGTGVNGDFYFRTSNDDVYNKSGGAWSVIGNLRGSTGADGATGATGAQQGFGAYWRGGGSPVTLIDPLITLPRRVQNGTILQVNVQGDQSGSAQIGIKKCAHGSYPGSLTDITGGSDIVLTGVVEYHDATLSGWTTAYLDGDVFEFELKSVSGFHRLGIILSPI